MGTEVHLLWVGSGADRGLRAARALVESLDRRWSRFRPDSELSRLNAAAGRPTVLSSDTFALVATAVDAWRLTHGRFDPTVLRALTTAGYDRSFEFLAPDGAAPLSDPGGAVPGCAGIALEPGTGLVCLPRGVGLDLGGIAKGHAADLVVAAMLAAGAGGALANLGGDLRVAGLPPDPAGWLIGIEDPHDPSRDLGVLALADGAVTTSSRLRRRWRRGGRPVHHLIDPATGRPTDSGVDAAVVVADRGVRAEILAKAAVVAGPVAGAEILTRAGATGLLVLPGGDVVRLPGLDQVLAP
jgi:thiamine biosynthesis lipoprotein